MKKLWQNPIIRVFIVTLIAILVFDLSNRLMLLSALILPHWLVKIPASMNAIFKTILALISIIIILLIPGKKLSDFGFCMPKKFNYLKLFGVTTGVALGSIMIFSPLYMVVLSNIFGVSPGNGIAGNSTFWIQILGIWFWSSITEEIFNRGLIQGLIQDLSKFSFLGLSLPVWISGLIFGCFHFTMFKTSNSPFFVLMIVSNATLIGLTAAYYREKSASILPAIIVHITANIVGSFPLLLQ